MKQKKCPICKEHFMPRVPLQKVCSPKCAMEYAKQQSDKAERKRIKERLDAIKPRSAWIKEAQAAFNAYIRERDHALPCISCGRHHGGDNHAGHYRTTAAAPQLRYDEDNVHKQCCTCNTYQHGNIVEYRINLIKRIGEERVGRLESDNSVKKYSIDELKEIKETYKNKLKELKLNREGE